MQIKIGWTALALLLILGQAQADVADTCPKVSNIKASPNTDQSSYDDFIYSATVGSVEWVGSTMGTNDTYLEEKYSLALDKDGSTDRICSYGGKTVVENGVKSVPYLRLTPKK